MLPTLFLESLLLSSFTILTFAKSESKYVRINIDAKWPQTPLVLEASEFIASRDDTKFWTFVEHISNPSVQENTLDSYNLILDAAKVVLSVLEIDLLKFALASRSFSPRIELHRQIVAQFDAPSCNAFYSFDGKQYCSFNELMLQLEKVQNRNATIVHAFDHVYPGSEDNTNVVILYGAVGSNEFLEAHKQMVDVAKQRKAKYIFRHHIMNEMEGKVQLSGYGIELAVKSTEYKAVDDQKVDGKGKDREASSQPDQEDEVEGFLFGTLRDLHPESVEPLENFRNHLKESTKELAPLKVWQLQDLSFQAAQRVMGSSLDQRLKVLRDISQNIPMLARSLVKTSVKDELRSEIQHNQKKFQEEQIDVGEAALFINGLQIQLDTLDAFSLEKLLLKEMTTMNELDQLGLEAEKAVDLLTLDVKPQSENFAVDTRSESVQWINNLEKDAQYQYWPSQLEEILRPTFPGMLRYIARNIFNVILCFDPTNDKGIKIFSQVQDFVSNSMPARFGVLFVSDGSPEDDGMNDAGVALVRAFSFIKAEKGTKEAFDFVTEVYRRSDQKAPSPATVTDLFKRWYGSEDLKDAMAPNTDYDDLRKTSYRVFQRLGLKHLPQILVNGMPLSNDELQVLDQALIEKILSLTPSIQQATYMGQIQSYQSEYDYVMSRPNVVKRLNAQIQTIKGEYLTFSLPNRGHKFEDVADLSQLTSNEVLNVLSNEVKYFLADEGAVTTWVIADADTVPGRKLIRSAMEFILKDSKKTRTGLILCPSKDVLENKQPSLNQILQSVIDTRVKMVSGIAKFIIQLLDESNEFEKLVEDVNIVMNLSESAKGFNKKKLQDLLQNEEEKRKIQEKLLSSRMSVEKIIDAFDNASYVICNGRVIGPLDESNVFTTDDFELLQSFENSRSASKIKTTIENMELSSIPLDSHERFRSDMVMIINAILSSKKQATRSKLKYYDNQHSVIHLEPKKKNLISYDVIAVLDPLTADAQKIVPILMVLVNVTNVNLKVFFNCKGKLSEMPLKRFYRYVLNPELTFNDAGKLSNSAPAIFHNMPQSALLTLIMDTPQSWMVEAVNSPYDLDNIHLAEADGYVYGDFELEYIVIEGHCQDANTGAPPRGLQFTLGTSTKPDMFDTIVMANLGYFQLKAYPGAFTLKLREGRSSEIYKIDSIGRGDDSSEKGHFSITLDSFSGSFLTAKVSRLPGKEHDDLLSGGSEPNQGLWDSIASYVTNGKDDIGTNGTIHIFSVATGRLYERFLRIMMLTVLKHTKNPVKFWFLKNYLSSTFTSFLPHMAKEYNFDYALVQYQWPSWLLRQTEKQRIIWGYKILFLDVLFPLNLNRVIFVDADQVVRTDLKELMEMDLDGAPYAYTPFCDDRPEMDGFRFWKQGYWRSHLSGRPYHISALYVVDLKQFRRLAAGDRLRGQYQGLAQDPNSLANLDQDLPNNMIHQVPIKSLPQEWLWCETWCSDASKKYAKTIDLCNNPQTKEPKLRRATRIVEEWPQLDAEIMELQEKIAKKSSSHTKDNIVGTTPKDEL